MPRRLPHQPIWVGQFIPVPCLSSLFIGNVSHEVPSFHGGFTIPTEDNISPHHHKFAEAAGGDPAHEAAIKCGKGLAMLAIRALSDSRLVEAAKEQFQLTQGD